MTSQRIAERLIVLNEAADGLLARCHGLLMFKRPPVLDYNVDKVCQRLLKRFPEFHAESVEKVSGFSSFKDHASEIHDSLQLYYGTIVDVYRLNEEAMKTLNDVASDILDLEFDINRELMIWFLDLLVHTVQLVLLLNHLSDRREFTIVYALAYFYTQSTYEPNFQNVAKFIVEFGEPIRKIQEECEQMSHCVGHTLVGLQSYLSYTSLQYIRDKQVFNLTDLPEGICMPNTQQVYTNLMYLHKYQLWLAFGFLICPAELQHHEARELLRNVLSVQLVMPVYRDVYVNLHELYEQTFSHFKSKKVKLTKYKDILRSSHTAAVNDSVDLHIETRNCLRSEIVMMICLLQSYPGLLGPKLPIVLAALALCRQEIMWYFRHLHASQDICASVAKDWKHFNESTFTDRSIGEVIHQVVELNALIRQHTDVIRDYYIEKLQHDIAALRPLVEELQNDKRISKHAKMLVADIVATQCNNEDTERQFDSFRMNWYRVLVAFSSAQSGPRSGAAKSMMNDMNHIIFHSRCVDELDVVVRQTGGLHTLFYRTPLFLELFLQCIQSGNEHPRFCMSFVCVVAEFQCNLNSFANEEQSIIASDTVAMAEQMLSSIADHIDTMLQRSFSEAQQFAYQIRQEEAAVRIQSQINGEELSPYPGFECLEDWRFSILHVNQTRQNIAFICCALRQHDQIQVYDHVFSPAEYVVRALRSSMRARMRRLVLTETENCIERPSRFLMKMRSMIRSGQELSSHINIDLNRLLSEIILSEFYDSRVVNVGCCSMDSNDDSRVLEDRSPSPKANSEKASCGELYFEFYSTFLLEWFTSTNVVYSELSLGFLTRKHNVNTMRSPTTRSTTKDKSHEMFSESLLAQDYTDIRELRDFCTFAGPHGVIALEGRILSLIASRAAEIKSILMTNESILRNVSCRMAQAMVWIEGATKLTGLDELFRLSVEIGTLLRFRATLFQALKEIVEERAGFLLDTVNQVYRRNQDQFVAEGAAAILLAHQLGIDDPLQDTNLQNALSSLKSTRGDIALWRLLSCLYGFHFVSSSWSRTVFEMSTYAHTNNGHCIADCIKALIISTQAIPIEGQINDEADVLEQTRIQLESFLRFASYTIFHMKARETNYLEHHLQSIKIFLHHFVNLNEELGMNQLEETLPFTIIRTDLIQLNEQQLVGRLAVSIGEDEKEEE